VDLSAFDDFFVGIGWICRRMMPSRVWPSMLSRRSFKELGIFEKEEQERLFSESWNAAFSGWRWFVLECTYWLFVFGIFVVTQIAGLGHHACLIWLAGAGYLILIWLFSRLERRYVRPFLKGCIQKYHPSQGKSVASGEGG